VIIKIAAREPCEFSLDLSYIITGASWRSTYQVRVESKDKSCVLVYQGVIRNTTGENWDNVLVTLSTAEPSKGGEPPRVPSLVVRLYDSRPNVYVPQYNDYQWNMNDKAESYEDYESFSDEDDEYDYDMKSDKKKESHGY